MFAVPAVLLQHVLGFDTALTVCEASSSCRKFNHASRKFNQGSRGGIRHTESEGYYVHHFGDNPDSAFDRSSPHLALQLRLGLLPERRARTDPPHRDHPFTDGSPLSQASKPTIINVIPDLYAIKILQGSSTW